MKLELTEVASCFVLGVFGEREEKVELFLKESPEEKDLTQTQQKERFACPSKGG